MSLWAGFSWYLQTLGYVLGWTPVTTSISYSARSYCSCGCSNSAISCFKVGIYRSFTSVNTVVAWLLTEPYVGICSGLKAIPSPRSLLVIERKAEVQLMFFSSGWQQEGYRATNYTNYPIAKLHTPPSLSPFVWGHSRRDGVEEDIKCMYWSVWWTNGNGTGVKGQPAMPSSLDWRPLNWYVCLCDRVCARHQFVVHWTIVLNVWSTEGVVMWYCLLL